MNRIILLPMAFLMLMSFAEAPYTNFDFKSTQSGMASESLTTIVYLAQAFEYDCVEILVVVTKTVDQTEFVFAMGKMTVGEGCMHKDMFGNVDVIGESPNNLTETIENNLEVSYAIKKWYYDYQLKQKDKPY